MEIDRKPIETAKPGDDIGIKVKEKVREHDVVYKEQPSLEKTVMKL